jgi:predicted nucleotidyltransferase
MTSNLNFHPTPYPYVNDAVHLLLKNVRAVLKDNFVGLYLHGSLASGDFDPGHSDIDFLVVTERELSKATIAELETMHQRMMKNGPEWVKKLEGTYYSKKTLFRYGASKRKTPYLNEGRFYMTGQGIDWIINRHILREKGIIAAGPPIRLMIAPVSPEDIRQAVIRGIIKYWTPKLNDPDWMKPPGHQPYIAVTCGRALYTLKTGKVKSKLFSARWALKNMDKKWHDLIEYAISWRYGMPSGDIEKTREMARYTVEIMKANQR